MPRPARCRVLAFEPSAPNFHVLARNLQLNPGLRVDAYCVALAGRTGLGAMNLATPAAGMAMAQFGKPGEASPYWHGTVGATHGMVGFTVDEFIARFGPPFPTHVKIDVDGLEPDILEGAATTLADGRVRSVMAEVSLTDESARHRSLQALERAGFALLSRGAEQGGGAERAANHFFARA
jgi:FkbM family methyltransferase